MKTFEVLPDPSWTEDEIARFIRDMRSQMGWRLKLRQGRALVFEPAMPVVKFPAPTNEQIKLWKSEYRKRYMTIIDDWGIFPYDSNND